MTTAPKAPTPPHRMLGLLLSRRFWIVVGAIVVAGLAIYGLVAVPIGPTPYSFRFSSSACQCQQAVYTNHSFPDRAYVKLSFTSHYIGNVSEYILIVNNPSGTPIIYANMIGGSFGQINYANVSETFTTNAGGMFEFELLAAYPRELPGITAWVNGTYNAPFLS